MSFGNDADVGGERLSWLCQRGEVIDQTVTDVRFSDVETRALFLLLGVPTDFCYYQQFSTQAFLS